MEKNGNGKKTGKTLRNGACVRIVVCLMMTLCMGMTGFPTENENPASTKRAGYAIAVEAGDTEAPEAAEWTAAANEDGAAEGMPEAEASGSGEDQGGTGEESGSGEGQGGTGEGSGSGEGQGGTGEDSGSGEGQGGTGEGSGSGEGQDGPGPSADPTETTTVPPTPTPSPEPEETEDPGVFVIEGDVLIRYTGKKTKVEIPDGVRVIGPGAFDRNKTIEEAVLPDSVEEIGEGVFADCSNLKKVTRSANSRLSVLGEHAFAYCTKLDKTFAEGIDDQAENAFEGVPDTTPTPEPAQDATPTPNPTLMPEPTLTPDEEGDGEDDFYDDIEWEIPASSTRTTTGGKPKPRHTRNRTKFTHDYDQVMVGAGETEPMQELTLGGETFELSLKGNTGEPTTFTAAFAAGEELWDGSAEAAERVDTLVLKATSDAGNLWTMNGNVLRQLYKTGIDYLVFRDARADIIVPTEGFLAGRVYDEIKSRGVGGRKFDYTLETGDALKWAVTVEGEVYGLDENPAAPIYLTGVTVVSKNPGNGNSARADGGNGSKE